MRFLSALTVVWLSACASQSGGGDRRVDAGGGNDDSGEDCLGVEPTPAGPCGCGADCLAEALCATEVETGFPGGWCLQACDADRPCPEGTFCEEVEAGSGSGVCQETCTSTSDCRAGWICTPALTSPNPKICWPFCQADSDCAGGVTCDEWLGTCGQPYPEPGDPEIGEACGADVECRTGFCDQGPHYPGGYCSSACSVERQGCPADAYCIGPADDDWGSCMARCDSHADCREAEGYRCLYNDGNYDDSWCELP